MAAGCLCAPDPLSLITSLFSLRALSDHSNFHSNLKIKFLTAGDTDTCGRLLLFKVSKLLQLTLPGPQVFNTWHLWSLGKQAGLNASPSKCVWEFFFCYSIQLVWWHICHCHKCQPLQPTRLGVKFLLHWFTGDFQNLRGQCSILSVFLSTYPAKSVQTRSFPEWISNRTRGPHAWAAC